MFSPARSRTRRNSGSTAFTAASSSSGVTSRATPSARSNFALYSMSAASPFLRTFAIISATVPETSLSDAVRAKSSEAGVSPLFIILIIWPCLLPPPRL